MIRTFRDVGAKMHNDNQKRLFFPKKKKITQNYTWDRSITCQKITGFVRFCRLPTTIKIQKESCHSMVLRVTKQN
jgi:hypothetical protein